jgi:hypothetical protein
VSREAIAGLRPGFLWDDSVNPDAVAAATMKTRIGWLGVLVEPIHASGCLRRTGRRTGKLR